MDNGYYLLKMSYHYSGIVVIFLHSIVQFIFFSLFLKSLLCFDRMEKKYDVIVFGGSGFTGEYVIREMFSTSVAECKKWAIAGRSKQKMSNTLDSISQELSVLHEEGN